MKGADYWKRVFSLIQGTLKENGGSLPSVSEIAGEHRDPYKILISTLISLRTKDAVTLASSRALFSQADTPQKMLELSLQQIEEAIYPAGFYKTKAVRIREISQILIEKYHGVVPADQKQLLELPGVGIKTANLTLNLGFGIDAICVDTHVHRISNRLGWINTSTPEQSEKDLQHIMPKEFWIPLNELLVAYGQHVCTPLSPYCSRCPLEIECPKNGVSRSR
jgi:endonuclease-3